MYIQRTKFVLSSFDLLVILLKCNAMPVIMNNFMTIAIAIITQKQRDERFSEYLSRLDENNSSGFCLEMPQFQ